MQIGLTDQIGRSRRVSVAGGVENIVTIRWLMNRRDFIKLSSAALASLILPDWDEKQIFVYDKSKWKRPIPGEIPELVILDDVLSGFEQVGFKLATTEWECSCISWSSNDVDWFEAEPQIAKMYIDSNLVGEMLVEVMVVEEGNGHD